MCSCCLKKLPKQTNKQNQKHIKHIQLDKQTDTHIHGSQNKRTRKRRKNTDYCTNIQRYNIYTEGSKKKYTSSRENKHRDQGTNRQRRSMNIHTSKKENLHNQVYEKTETNKTLTQMNKLDFRFFMVSLLLCFKNYFRSEIYF